MLIGNRDFVTHCVGADSLAPLAAAGLAGGIHTYVAVLSAPSTTDQNGRDPVGDAAAIALAGGTEVFDATVDSEVGARALQTITADLGSCLYDAPDGVDLDANRVETTLTYFNTWTQSQVSIPYGSECSELASGASGWNLDSFGRIRVCGAECSELRNAAQLTSAFAAQTGRPAPRIPLRLAQPCGP